MKWWRIGVGIAILSLVFALIQLPDGKLHLREHGALKADIDNWVAKVAPDLAWAKRVA